MKKLTAFIACLVVFGVCMQVAGCAAGPRGGRMMKAKKAY